MKELVNTSVKMPVALHVRLANLAKTRQRSAHALMLQAIEGYVDREEKRDAWRREGIAAWEEYQMTGLHLTNDEAKDWLARLAEGDDVEPPHCHL